MTPASLSRAVLIAIFTAILASLVAAPVLAGTSGGISGRVVDAQTRAPIAGVRVAVVSPSGAASAVTDARGHFAFLDLPPDTYALTASKDGYQTAQQTGVTVQADVQLTFDVALTASVKVLGVVHVDNAGLVRPGQTVDVYAVNPSTANAAGSLAGTGSVNQAYGALATIPGIYVPQGQQGWYQPIYIRGGDQDQIGYELDGVPVNRSYDNAPESMLSDIGQQELQVYTGGADASSQGQGISGYVNQVVKRGTYPPSGSFTYGVGAPTGYQHGAFEYGAATPDNRFSYYFAGSTAVQEYRYFDQFNGVGEDQSGFFFPSFEFNASGNPIDLPGTTLGASQTRDGEDIANFHYRISRADDLQLLHVDSNLYTYTYGSLNDFGGASTFGTGFAYPDQYIYAGALDRPLDQSAVEQYLFPDSPAPNRSFQSQMSPDLRAVANNGFSLTKLQWSHPMGQGALLKVIGYSDYSNWFIDDPIPVPSPFLYVLPEISFGTDVSLVDQLGDKHLLTLTGSVESSREYRWTTGYDFVLGGSPTNSGLIGGNFDFDVPVASLTTGGGHCFDASSGFYTSCFAGGSQADMILNTGQFVSGENSSSNPITLPPPGSPGALAGAQWIATDNGYGGLLNQVSPIITAGSADDRIRASDTMTIDVGARVERYDDRLVNEDDGYPARAFWLDAVNNEYCVLNGTLQSTTRPIDPMTGEAGPCPAGSPVHLTLTNDAAESNSVFEPRVGATYQASPGSVLRLSYGTFARPPNASWVQYGTLEQDLPLQMASKFLPYGFTSPQHDIRPDVSHNVDLSWERNIPGTDASFSITPYYRGTMGQFENILLDTNGDESGVNVGSERSAGLELAFQKGDFRSSPFSGLISVSLNRSRFTYAKFASGLNVVQLNDQQIATYNAYTSACAAGGSAFGKTQFGEALCGSTSAGLGAAACFQPGGAPDPSCADSGDVPNPYWNKAAQPLQDPLASYEPYDVIPDEPLSAGNGFGSPVTATLLGQYRRLRFSATPSVTFSSGSYYGTPLSTLGADPAHGAIATDVTSTIVIPDQFTGQFDEMGAFVQPSRITANLAFGYDVDKRSTLTLSLDNIVDACHQRGYAWDRSGFCAYSTLPFEQAPNSYADVSARGDPNYTYPYTVLNGNNNTQFIGTKLPFEAYLTLQVKT